MNEWVWFVLARNFNCCWKGLCWASSWEIGIPSTPTPSLSLVSPVGSWNHGSDNQHENATWVPCHLRPMTSMKLISSSLFHTTANLLFLLAAQHPSHSACWNFLELYLSFNMFTRADCCPAEGVPDWTHTPPCPLPPASPSFHAYSIRATLTPVAASSTAFWIFPYTTGTFMTPWLLVPVAMALCWCCIQPLPSWCSYFWVMYVSPDSLGLGSCIPELRKSATACSPLRLGLAMVFY